MRRSQFLGIGASLGALVGGCTAAVTSLPGDAGVVTPSSDVVRTDVLTAVRCAFEATVVDSASRIAAGVHHACVRRVDGGVWCWGRNAYGELGDAARYAELVFASRELGWLRENTVVLGLEVTCGLSSSGEVRCAGSSGAGLLANGGIDLAPHPAPTLIPLPRPAVSLFAGIYGACAVDEDRVPWCWGGLPGDSDQGRAPVRIDALAGVSSMALGNMHSCLSHCDGRVSCFGETNTHGQLGAAPDRVRARSIDAPVLVEGAAEVVEVVVGRQSSCALRRNGTVLCWGYNGTGELGDGTRQHRSTPGLVSGLGGVTSLSISSQRSEGEGDTVCAVSMGRVFCWGRAMTDLLLPSEGAPVLTPRAVEGLPGEIASVRLGNSTAIAVSRHGEVYCWGYAEHCGVATGGRARLIPPTRIVLP